MPTRRTVLTSGALLATGALGVRAAMTGTLTPGMGKPYAPWHDLDAHPAGSAESLIAHAILAASPHNTQPWRFTHAPSGLGLTSDLSRNLGSFDPFLREMHIGIGATIENLVIAASTQRRVVRVRFEPRDLTAIAARAGAGPLIALDIGEADTVADPLAPQIPKRHTNRGPYQPGAEARHVVADALREAAIDQTLCRIVIIEDDIRAHQFDDLVVESTARIVGDAEMVKDSDRWFRRPGDVGRQPDGLTLDAAGLSPVMAAIAKMMPPLSAQASHEFWLRSTKAALATTPVRGFIYVPSLYALESCIGAGRAWQRFHLAATARGLALQPVNQPIEIVDREAALGKPPEMARRLMALADGGGWRPTFAFRAGFAARSAPPSPRRPVKDVLDS